MMIDIYLNGMMATANAAKRKFDLTNYKEITAMRQKITYVFLRI